MNRLRFVLLLGVILAFGTILTYWLGTPEIVSNFPADGSTALPASTPLYLTFSRQMQEDSVIEHLRIEPLIPGSYAWQKKTLIFTPAQPWPAGVTVHVKLEAGGRAVGLLSLPLRQGTSWSFTIRQPRLAYLYPSNGPANIYAQDLLAGESERLTNNPGGVLDFSINPSGTAIYYSVRNAQEGSDIYRLDLTIEASTLPTPGATPAAKSTSKPPSPVSILSCLQAICRSPVISPKGDYLAYERTAILGGNQPNYPQVWYFPLQASQNAGLNLPQPILAADALHQTLQPAWSPDGLLTYYDSNAAAYVILDPGSGKQTLFPNQTGESGSWNPDGHEYVAAEINFLEAGPSGALPGLQALANSHLLLFNWENGSTRDLTPGEDMEDTSPVFSPDGIYLAFARKYLDSNHWSPGRQLWLMRVDTGNARPLTDDPLYNHFDFAWSQAGDQLAFVRFNQTILTEPPEIWTVDPLTGQTARIVVGGYAPKWIP